MVDLVKLRKKAKKTRDQGSSERDQGSEIRDQVVEPAEVAQPAKVVEPPHDQGPAPVAAVHPPADATDLQSLIPDLSPAISDLSSNKLAQFRETAGKRREGFIEEDAEGTAADQVELLTFVLAGEQYAVAIDHIVEIVTPRTATRVPNADQSIVGIMSLRGTIVTIIDVRQKLGHPPGEGSNDTRTIVAERAGETLGFEVDRVLRVLKVGIPAIEAQPVVHSSEKSEAIRGVFRHANALTILLDLDKLLA